MSVWSSIKSVFSKPSSSTSTSSTSTYTPYSGSTVTTKVSSGGTVTVPSSIAGGTVTIPKSLGGSGTPEPTRSSRGSSGGTTTTTQQTTTQDTINQVTGTLGTTQTSGFTGKVEEFGQFQDTRTSLPSRTQYFAGGLLLGGFKPTGTGKGQFESFGGASGNITPADITFTSGGGITSQVVNLRPSEIGITDYSYQEVGGQSLLPQQKESKLLNFYEKASDLFLKIDTLGVKQLYEARKEGKLIGEPVPITPTPATASKLLGTSRLVFTGVTQNINGRKIITDIGFMSKYDFFPLGTTQKGIATTETIFGKENQNLFISKGVGQLFKRGATFPSAAEKVLTGQKFASTSMGLAVEGKGKTAAFSVGRLAPKILKSSESFPFADVSIIKKGNTITGLVGRTFVGTGETISTKISKPIQTAGILKDIEKPFTFRFIPEGTRGQVALSSRVISAGNTLNLGMQREVGILQTQQLIRGFSSTIQPPKVISGVSQLTRLTSLTGIKYVGSLDLKKTITGYSVSSGLMTGNKLTSSLVQRNIPIQKAITGVIPTQKTRQKNIVSTIPLLNTKTIQISQPRLTQSTRGTPFIPPRLSFPTSPIPLIPYGFLGLGSRRGRGSSLFGNFYSSYTPSLTARTFRLYGKVSKSSLRTGIVSPFQRRYLLGSKRKVKGGRKKRR